MNELKPQRPKIGDIMRVRGGGLVKVTMVGMRYANIVDADTEKNIRGVRLQDLLPVTVAPAVKQRKAATRVASTGDARPSMEDLDAEFLGGKK